MNGVIGKCFSLEQLLLSCVLHISSMWLRCAVQIWNIENHYMGVLGCIWIH